MTTVVSTVRDSVVDGNRWVLFDEVYCSGPDLYCGGTTGIWYHVTDDNYLLEWPRRFMSLPPDTVFATTPYAAFEVTEPADETVSPLDPECAEHGMSVGVGENASILDSTRFTLNLHSGNIFCDSNSFVYKIGMKQGAFGHLEGAFVNGYRYLEQDLLSTVLGTDQTERAQIELDVFPNPAREFVTVRASDLAEEIRIVDVTGRTVRVACCGQREWTVDLVDLPSGVYFALLSTTRGTLSTAFVKTG